MRITIITIYEDVNKRFVTQWLNKFERNPYYGENFVRQMKETGSYTLEQKTEEGILARTTYDLSGSGKPPDSLI